MSFFDTSAFSLSSSPSASASASTARVIPAQVDFLTIFNPSLGGDSEEAEAEAGQIVCWVTKADPSGSQHRRTQSQSQSQPRRTSGDRHDKRDGTRRRKSDENEITATDNDHGIRDSQAERLPKDQKQEEGSAGTEGEGGRKDHQDEETNYRLRQIGLARGMVEFVKNFSNDRPVSSVETQKSRIILHELEQGWWILASIGLTRLPAAAKAQSDSPVQISRGSKGSKGQVSKDASYSQLNSNKQSQDPDQVQYEYSAREVASPHLLLAQVLRAHDTFMLHHAPSLWDLYHRVGKTRFVTHLQGFWEKFIWDWDVLLHGSPAVEVYGSCMKLAGGGELGIGVGEEEWGSGEREVLEDFVARTEGCTDVIVGRYGDAPLRLNRNAPAAEDDRDHKRREQDRWLGNGDDPGPADGVVFSGVGMLSRRSMATISQWMEAIFKHGEDAYGVGENPSARPRQKRNTRRPKPVRTSSDTVKRSKKLQTGVRQGDEQLSEEPDIRLRARPRQQRTKTPDLRRQAIENSFLPPGIPAPLVSSVERSLEEAIAKAEVRASSRSPKSSPSHELSQDEAMGGQEDRDKPDSGSSWFDTDKMTKVLTLGYGTSWTLNPKGFGNEIPKQDSTKTENGQEEEDLLLPEESPSQRTESTPAHSPAEGIPSGLVEEALQQLDPSPEIFADENDTPSKGLLQHLEKSVGRFIIGLSGDLENTEFEDDETSDDDSIKGSKTQRIFLRTLNVEMIRVRNKTRKTSVGSRASRKSLTSDNNSDADTIGPKPKTSAAASVDGPAQQSKFYHEKMRVAVYVHQPFIFVFLFSLQTPNLTIPAFYRGIHHQLGPLQGPLLKRTDPELVAERIKDALCSRTNEPWSKQGQAISQLERAAAGGGNTIYDLVYDPVKLTIRTSIPNIPIPVPVSDRSAMKTTTVSGSWYTLGIPIGVISSASPSPSRSPSRQKQLTNKEKEARLRAEQWTRIDALSVHQQILSSYSATHSDFAPSAQHRSSASTTTTTNPSVPPSSLLKDAELERTIKTNRGWWILWMRVPSTATNAGSRPDSIFSSSSSTKPGTAINPGSDGNKNTSSSTTTTRMSNSTSSVHAPIFFPQNSSTDKEAFLIRKSTDPSTSSSSIRTSIKNLGISSSSTTGSGSPSSGRWLLREQPRDPSRSTSGGTTNGSSGFDDGSGSNRGNNSGRLAVGEGGAGGGGVGIGIDARKWIDGLLTLTL